MKKLSLVVMLVLLLSGMTSCGTVEERPLDFSVGGMTVTLTNRFSYSNAGEYNACFLSDAVAVYVLKEDFEKFSSPEEMTLTDYAEAVLANNDKNLPISVDDGIVSFSFEESIGGIVQSYYICVYRGSDAFWTIQFICEQAQKAQLDASMKEWAKSVRFKENDN